MKTKTIFNILLWLLLTVLFLSGELSNFEYLLLIWLFIVLDYSKIKSKGKL